MTKPTNPGDARAYIVPRPCTSQWICKFAADSPLYWYAANKRKDGMLNTTIPDDAVKGGNQDVGYKAGHPNSGITSKEKVLLREWIDSGAQYK